MKVISHFLSTLYYQIKHWITGDIIKDQNLYLSVNRIPGRIRFSKTELHFTSCTKTVEYQSVINYNVIDLWFEKTQLWHLHINTFIATPRGLSWQLFAFIVFPHRNDWKHSNRVYLYLLKVQYECKYLYFHAKYCQYRWKNNGPVGIQITYIKWCCFTTAFTISSRIITIN